MAQSLGVMTVTNSFLLLLVIAVVILGLEEANTSDATEVKIAGDGSATRGGQYSSVGVILETVKCYRLDLFNGSNLTGNGTFK